MRSGARESTGNLQGKTHIGKDEKGEICLNTKYLILCFIFEIIIIYSI